MASTLALIFNVTFNVRPFSKQKKKNQVAEKEAKSITYTNTQNTKIC